jgi:penicillin amidase
MKKALTLFFSVCAVLCFTCADSFSGTSPVTIYRDDFGAPHVFAVDLEGLYYGYGYAAAQDRLFQMDMLRRTYWGRVSEVHGAKFLEFDKAMRRDNLTRAQVKDQISGLDRPYPIVLKSFADGMNAYITEAAADPGSKLPLEFKDFGVEPEKWKDEDVAAVFLSVMGVFMDFSRELENLALLDSLIKKHGEKRGKAIFSDLVPGNDPEAYSTIPDAGPRAVPAKKKISNSAPLSVARALLEETKALRSAYTELGIHLPGEAPSASYAFLVSAKKSASGNALLMGGPQFNFHLPSDLYEVGLHGPGIDAVGSTLTGYPFIMFGQTERTAFSSTAGVDNLTDYFQEKLNPKNPRQYWFMGKWRPMEQRKEIFKVKGEDPKEATFFYTVHGPVIKTDAAKGVAYSKQLSCKEDYLSGFVSFYELMKAQTPEEFKNAAALSSLSVNVYFADTAGNIGYFHQGRYPKRSGKTNPLFPTQGTGEYEWQGFHPTAQNPQIVNPATGIIANWNNKPAKNWPNGDLGGVFGGAAGWGWDHRVTLLTDSVKGKEKISVEDLKQMVKDVTLGHLWAQRFKPFLLEVLKRNMSADPRIPEALEILASWDDTWADANDDGLYDHPGLSLFNAWWDLALKNTFEDELGEYWGALESSVGGPFNWERRKRYPGGHPLFLRALLGKKAPAPLSHDYFNGKKDDILLKSFIDGLDRAEKKFGCPELAAWKMPVTPMAYAPTTIMGVPTTPEKVKMTFFMERGTENHIVEMKPGGADGVMVVPPGSSGFVKGDGAKGPHYEDQLDMFNTFRYKPLLIKEDAVKAKAKSQLNLQYTYE